MLNDQMLQRQRQQMTNDMNNDQAFREQARMANVQRP
jgi:hypothetical protein